MEASSYEVTVVDVKGGWAVALQQCRLNGRWLPGHCPKSEVIPIIVSSDVGYPPIWGKQPKYIDRYSDENYFMISLS